MECPENLMEKMAALEHERWSGWMLYQFERGTFPERDGTWIMPAWAVERWRRQANTKYADLSEREKETDRQEVRRTWAVIVGHLGQGIKEYAEWLNGAALKKGGENAGRAEKVS